MAGSYKTEAVVLRSLRYGEADRVLHLLTAERGRVNAIAKGVRRTGSRFGGRLEPLGRVALLLHEGRGELHTVSGADLVRSHAGIRERPAALGVAQIGAEAVLRLHPDPEPQPRAYAGLCRFLALLEQRGRDGADPALDPLGLAFQLKLLALEGYAPQLAPCAGCGAEGPLVGFSAAAGGAVCPSCLSAGGAFGVDGERLSAIGALIDWPLDQATVPPAAARVALRVVEETYAYHGGFRLRTLRGAAGAV